MAMETMLRIICGKVDSMEAWMTEISFGMTELDLKLRNIAHNIEGTAANVDDEAANVYRWAAPPADDSAAAARAAATVKKKLGPNKTTVRMTGMVASIIDTLGAPVEERDKAVAAVTATTGKQRPKKSLVAAVALKKVHKKKSGHPHHHEKTRGHDDEGGHSRDNSVDNAGHLSSGDAAVHDPNEANPSAVGERHDVAGDPQNALSGASESERSPRVPPLSEQTVIDSEAEDTEGGESTGRSGQDSDRSVRDVQAAPVPATEAAVPVQTTSQQTLSSSPLAQSAPALDQSARSQRNGEPPLSADPRPNGSEETSGSRDAGARAKPESTQDAPSNVLAATAAPQSGDQAPSSSASQPAFEPPSAGPAEPSATDQAGSPRAASPLSTSTKSPAQRTAPANAPSASGYLPLPPQDTASPSFILHSTAAATATTPTVDAADAASSVARSSDGATAASLPTPGATIGEKEVTPSAAVAPLAKSSSRKAAKAASSSQVASLLRKSSSHKKASIVKRKSKAIANSDADPLAGAGTGMGAQTDSVPSTTEKESLPPVAATAVTDSSPTQAAEPETARGDGAGINDSSSNNVASESEASALSSSESESGSESDSQDDGDDDEENAAHDNNDDTARKSGGPNASTMTRTITALKKLKKANMLTAEEEEELKQRAQDKWFKLKGHMKEKKKKDVANILLKRKKNVFTVSARIELLEEKSKEVFASIKQLTADLKTKVDLSANESLRRHVHDINMSLQALDHRLTVGATPAMEKVTQLARDVENVRCSFAQQLVLASDDLASTKRTIAAAADEHRCALEFMSKAFEDQVASLQAASDAKLRELPAHTAALEGIKRAVRRKADLKQFKELEARLLGHDADSEDCLVRCLSCHKEVTNATGGDTDATGDVTGDDERAAYMKKVNPGTSAGKIYRSNVPFSAQLLGAYASIPEDATQVSRDSHAAEHPMILAPAPTSKTVTARRDESSKASAAAAPISSIQINASRAAMSPDRPISAPAAALKKKAPYVKSKSQLPPK